ncbi:hypothetical protein [Halobacteriovorax marinus]|uniref:hypothetical protein n=1 Tax=Halobacteriovorax marinus TaxID=97084 RepID=UPI003A9147C5
MKIAILGSGPLGLEAALHFDQLGAHVSLFSRGELGGMAKRVNAFASESSLEECWGEITSKHGRESLGLNIELSDIPSNEEYFEKYFRPLVEKGSQSIIVKPGNVERVHKRFLSLNEEVPGKSRLHDLFRVVYSTDPEHSILNQVESNPEVFEKLGEDVLNSLNESVESFEDFDLVIDASGIHSKANPIGPSQSFALNEEKLAAETKTFYGRECLENYKDATASSKHIVIVGDGHLAALLLCELDMWLEEDSERMVSLVTTQGQPFRDFLAEQENSTLALMTYENIQKYFEKLQIARRKFEEDLFKWRDLEPHIKAKTPAPQEPKSQLNLITASNVTSIDRLLDREGIFVTCETTGFRSGAIESEEQISTFACDSIFVCTGHKGGSSLATGLQGVAGASAEDYSHKEPGFYTLNGCLGGKNSLANGIKKISLIEREIMNFFSRA